MISLQFQGLDATHACDYYKTILNSLRISSGDKQIFVKEPWHCGQFQGQKAKIKILENNQEKTIEITDEVGLFTREIEYGKGP